MSDFLLTCVAVDALESGVMRLEDYFLNGRVQCGREGALGPSAPLGRAEGLRALPPMETGATRRPLAW